MDTNARINKVVSIDAGAIASVAASPADGDFERSRSAEDAERLSRCRLVIEEGPTPGSFIYKTMDSVTGEVIRQLPREEVVRLSRSTGYDAGSLIDTTV